MSVAAFAGRWQVYSGYLVSFTIQGREGFKLRVVGLYAPPSHDQIRGQLLQCIRGEMAGADKRGELFMALGDFNERDDARHRPIDSLLTAIGMVDLARHLNSLDGTHDAGGRLDRLYCSPGVLGMIHGLDLLNDEGFDHRRLHVRTSLHSHLDKSITDKQRAARRAAARDVLDLDSAGPKHWGKFVNGVATDLGLRIGDDSGLPPWVDVDAAAHDPMDEQMAVVTDRSVDIRERWDAFETAMSHAARTCLPHRRRGAGRGAGQIARPPRVPSERTRALAVVNRMIVDPEQMVDESSRLLLADVAPELELPATLEQLRLTRARLLADQRDQHKAATARKIEDAIQARAERFSTQPGSVLRSCLDRQRAPATIDRILSGDDIVLDPMAVKAAVREQVSRAFDYQEPGDLASAPSSLRQAIQPISHVEDSVWQPVHDAVTAGDVATALARVDADKAPGETKLQYRHYTALGRVGQQLLADLFSDMYAANW
ncbi:hypothetical protein BCR44DRAFT_1497702, partial [Catenaria anguillulae PL171]